MRTLFRTARKRHAQLDHDITLSVAWHKQHRRRERIAWDDMPAWSDAVDQVRNPVRRDLWQFVLFTGLRRDDAKTVRWADVDLDAGTIHRPKPKGGVDRAFTVPASAFVLDLLRPRREENRELFGDDGGWVFPTMTKRGVTHVVEVKEQVYYRDAKNKQRKRQHPILKSPHRLRDTFVTACREAKVDRFAAKILVNHTLPSADVMDGYGDMGVDTLREAVEKVAAFLLEKAARDGYAPRSASARNSVG